MGIRISEDTSYKEQNISMDKILLCLDPELNIFSKEDRRYYQDNYWLINKEPSLSNIPPSHMYAYRLRARYILDLGSYPMVISKEYRRKQMVDLVHGYKLPLSENGLGYLFGPLSHSTQHVSQELIQRQPVNNIGSE